MSNNETFKEIPLQFSVFDQLLSDIKGSRHFQRAFEIEFRKFISLATQYISLSNIDESGLDSDVFSLSLLSSQNFKKFAEQISTLLNSGSENKEVQALVENAVIYSLAAIYKNQITQAYMKGKNSEGVSTYMAEHSDTEYQEYVESAHFRLSKIVQSKNRFQKKKMLTVIGYLMNPSLQH